MTENCHVIVVESIETRAPWSVEHPDSCTDPNCLTSKLIGHAKNPAGMPNVPGPGRWRLLQTDRNALGETRLYVEPA